MGVSSQNSRMYYEDFLAAFEEGRKDSFEPKGADPGFAHVSERTAKLSPEKAEEKINKMVEQQLPVIQAVSFVVSICNFLQPLLEVTPTPSFVI